MENIKINSLEGLEAGSADIDSTKTYSNKDVWKMDLSILQQHFYVKEYVS